jgi:PleD family two-component response regulator
MLIREKIVPVPKWNRACKQDGMATKTGVASMSSFATATLNETLARSESQPMNLLIVDDEQYVRQLCADVAMQSGMKATAVATAEEALQVLENSAVDILITDIQL